MVERKTLLILSFTDLSRDPRVNRQIRILRQEYALVCVGIAPPQVENVEFVRVPPFRPSVLALFARIRAATLLLGREFERLYWSLPAVVAVVRQLADRDLDGVLANDIDSLPVALRVAKGAPVVFDAHEYAPRQFEDRLFFRLFLQRYRTYLCRCYMPLAKATMTVSAGIAEEYARQIGVRPTVIRSLPDYEELTPRDPGSGIVRVIHHGGASRSRRLDGLIGAVDLLDERFELYLMLVETSRGYLAELKRMARGRRRVHFLEPVALPEIVGTLNQFDLGVYLPSPLNFNQFHTLPNKFFEFIQARLGVAVAPAPEVAEIVRLHRLGVVTADCSPGSLAQALNQLSWGDIRRFKSNADRVARQYSMESIQGDLLAVVDAALS